MSSRPTQAERAFAKAITKWRVEAKMSQTELARRMKISQPALSQFERMERRVTLRRIQQIAGIFGKQVGPLLETHPRA